LLPTLSLLQLQLLQQQLALQMPATSSSSSSSSAGTQGHVPQIDNNLLSQIQAITATLLSRSSGTPATTNSTSPATNKVLGDFLFFTVILFLLLELNGLFMA